VQHLKESFPGVELFEADLLIEGSFDEGLKGCDYVLHTASPFQFTVENPQRDLVDPALKGTLNVLRSVAKAGTVKRVVLTSSVAAIAPDSFDPELVYTEEHWNMESNLDKSPYRYSKRLAEEAAWNFIKEQQEKGSSTDLVAINPSFVLGPPHSSRTDATSVRFVKSMLTGEWKDNGAAFACVDVRDVALAHILAFEKPEAHGRYIASSAEAVPHVQWARWLAEEFPDYSVPTEESSDPPKPRTKFDNTKIQKGLGIELNSPRKALVDMGHALIKLGVVPPPTKKSSE